MRPKKPVSRSILDFIDQLLYIYCPFREHQIVASRPGEQHYVMPN